MDSCALTLARRSLGIFNTAKFEKVPMSCVQRGQPLLQEPLAVLQESGG